VISVSAPIPGKSLLSRLGRLSWWPWAVLVVGLSLAGLRWQMLLRSDRNRLELIHSLETEALVDRLTHRIESLSIVLKGASSYLAREPRPTREDWRTYVAQLGMSKDHEAVQGMSFVPWIPRAELSAHLQQMKAEGFPDYTVVPGGSLPPDPAGLSSIVYIEPMDERNQRAFGRDMWADPIRREAMSQARDSGNVVLSGKLRLYQEGETGRQPGLVLYAPVYRAHVALDTVAMRRGALLGWSTIVLRMGDFMGSLLRKETARLDIRLFEGGSSNPGALLFDSTTARESGPDAGSFQRSMEAIGRTWTLQVRRKPDEFQLSAGQYRSEALIGGIVVTLLTFGMALLITGSERRAMALAETRGEEIQASESLFRTLFETAPLGMAIVNSDTGRLLTVNARLGRILGYAPDELLKRDFQSITHPDHLVSDLGSVRELAEGTLDEIHKEKRYLHRDGHTVWGRLSLVKLPTAEGAPRKHLSIIEDISESRARDEQVRVSEARFRTIFDYSPDPITLTRLSDGAVVMANPAWQALTGVAVEQAKEHSPTVPLSWIPPGERKALLAELHQVGQITARETTLRHLDGPVHQILLTAQVINFGNEDLALFMGKNVTERHQAESALRDSEARWQFALDGAGDGVWDWRADADTMFMSRGYKAMLGYGPDEVVDGTFTTWIAWIHPEDRERILGAVNHYLEHPDSAYQIEYRLRRKDGSHLWVLARGKAVAWDEAGRPTRMIGTHSDITERKLAEVALQESEGRFRSVVEESPIAIFLHREGRFLFLNSAALRLFGANRPGDLVGTPVLDRVHPDDLDIVRQRIARGLEQGTPNPVLEERLITLGGACVAAEVQATLITYSGQQAFMVFAQDITERKRAEEALRTNEGRLRLIGDQLPDSFLYQYATDPGAVPRFIHVSAGVERLCGLKAEDVVRDPGLLFDQMDPAMLPAYLEAEAASARDLTPFTMDFRNRRADGQWRWFRVRSAPRKQPDGTIIWEGISTDITDQKASQLQLQENEARFRGVVEHAGDAIFLNDEEGRIFLCNQAACTSTGYSMEELLGLRIMDFDSGYSAADNTQTRRRLKAGQQASILARHRRKDGTTFPVEVRISLLREAEPRQILAVVRDLTEREQVQEIELRARKAESLVLMAGGIAHDFNNLFQALQGNLEIMAIRAEEDPFLIQPLSRAMGALNRAVSLSWKMLDFSGHGFVLPAPLNLETWLPAYLATLQGEFPPTFQLDLTCEPVPVIKGDRSKLEQVVKAVLENALEATQGQAGRGRLRLFVDYGGDRPGPNSPGIWPLRGAVVPATVCLEIADVGPGVPLEKLGLICDPFYTTKDPGRGLGLPVVVGILTAHRAGLHIFNGEDGGLILRMHFPPGGP